MNSRMSKGINSAWKLGNHAFESRLLIGTGKFSSVEIMVAAVRAADRDSST